MTKKLPTIENGIQKPDSKLSKSNWVPLLKIEKDENGVSVSQHGKKIGRPKKLETAKLSKSAMRELYNAAFDRNAPEIFSVLFELAQSDKDLLKFVVEQRIGKPAQTVSGDEQAPLTVIVRRGMDDTTL